MTLGHLERRAMAKVWRRIVPFMIAVLFFSYLNKVGIGFAALQMNEDLGFSNTVFGAGAGFFAIGYALFGIPSTLLLHRMGARRWISLTMIGWSLCAAATAFVTSVDGFMAIRLLLGIAEAGFSPGAILCFSHWFPSEYRGRVLSTFFFIQPVALMIGGPVSSALLSWDGLLGLAGWQWLFIAESFPGILLGLAIFWFMTDAPADARWLTETQRAWLEGKLAQERQHVDTAHSTKAPIWRTLTDRRVWTLAVVYLGIGTSGIGAIFFLPLMIQSMGFSIWNTGLAAAVPATVAGLSLPLWGIWTDRSQRRETVVAAGCCTIACGLSGAAALLPSPWALLPICAVLIGFNGCLVAFWTLPSALLTGASAAAGIAFINVVGNLGNFSGPSLLGWTSDLTRSYAMGLTCLAAAAASAAAVITVHAARNRNLSDRTIAAT